MSEQRPPRPPGAHRSLRSGRRHRADATLDRWIRWTPLALVAIFALGVLSLLVVSSPRGASDPRGRPQGWLELAHGEVCFFGERQAFSVEQDWTTSERYRVRVGERVFEDSDSERLLRTFVRDALVGVRCGEAWRLRVAEDGGAAIGGARRRGALDWPLAFREETREGSNWCTAVFAPGSCEDRSAVESDGAPLASARSSEEIKEKISRTIAGELVRQLISS